jgi:hypothetical protein
VSLNPCPNEEIRLLVTDADTLLRNPINGIAGCCALAASGHAAAAPNVAKNIRRSMWLAM